MKTMVQRFAGRCIAGTTLFERKNKEYGNAFTAFGVLGVTCEILGAAMRLPQLVLWTPDHGKFMKTVLIDIFTDIHNYANMALICMEDDNWDGRR